MSTRLRKRNKKESRGLQTVRAVIRQTWSVELTAIHELACTTIAESAHCPPQLSQRLHFLPTHVPTAEIYLGHGLGSIATSTTTITHM